MSNLPSVGQLQSAFSRLIRETLTSEQLAQVNANNAKRATPDMCHSHDYCDANQVLLDALESLGVEWDMHSDEQTNLINAAWARAKACGFASLEVNVAEEKANAWHSEFERLMTLKVTAPWELRAKARLIERHMLSAPAKAAK